MIIEQPITGLSLMLSCGCNLSCKYCLIDQSKNTNSSFIQEQTINSLKDGSFLNNTLAVLKKINSSPQYIQNIEFWGQEPTLTLDLFTLNLENWIKPFPNLKSILFSTNGKSYPEKIIDFLKTMDLYAKKEIKITIQFSYDEEYSNQNLRQVDSSIITKNIQYIISQLNNINFSKIKIDFVFHSVISKNLINTLQDMNSVNNYCTNLFEWPKQFILTNKNPNLHIFENIGFGIEVPIEASQEDGINFTNFYRMVKYCNYNQTHNNIVIKCIKGIFTRTENNILKKYSNKDNNTLLDILKNINYDKDLQKDLSLGYSYCGANYCELKIMYDGTLLNCQNQIYDTNINFLNKDNYFIYSVKKSEKQHNKILNPLFATEEEIQQLFLTYKTIKENNFKLMYNNALNLIYILAKCHQIDQTYLTDKAKLLRHGFFIAKYNNCAYNKFIKTGNSIFINAGTIRLLCNGILDIILEDN